VTFHPTSPTSLQPVTGQYFAPSGLTGATAASRYVGGTASGAPTSGTFATGDFVIDQSGLIWICTAAGSPGTWTLAAPGALGVFGDGSDGAVTFDGSTTVLGLVPSGSKYTMTRDIQCTAVTINNAVTIQPHGYRIFCRGTVTNNGTIRDDGINASSATGAASTGSGTLASGRSGGTGATTNGGNAPNSCMGTAGSGGTGASGTAGTGAVSIGATAAISAATRTPYPLLTGQVLIAASAAMFAIAGGGGGGGDTSNSGGGGGSGGGAIGIIAYAVNNGSGTISCIGGNGFTPAAGNCGGGGGGSGGFIFIYTLAAWTAGSTAVTGGTHGSGVGTGGNGVDGTAGLVLNVVLH
jgi:hypothetical protein